jgi:hypothetical protein
MAADMYQSGWSQTPQQQGPPPRSSSNTAVWVLVALLSVIVLAAAAGGIWWLISSRQQTPQEGTPVTVTATAPAPVPAQPTLTAPAPAPAPAPAAGVPGTLIRSGGYLENVRVGSANTSEAFALNVWRAYMDNLAMGGTYNATVYAYSPATGEWYAMDCRETGNYVTCTGGNNAVVYLS